MVVVLRSAFEGKAIQGRRDKHDDWTDRSPCHLFFDFENFEYHVKPVLREWWLYYNGGFLCAFPYSVPDAVHVREVLP